jgi:feruloyl esterase
MPFSLVRSGRILWPALACILLLTASVGLVIAGRALAAVNPASSAAADDAKRCGDLVGAVFDSAEAPTRIISASLMDVPAAGLPAGGGAGRAIATGLKQYCQVTGYVAPQNKFELKLPLPNDWNQKFFFSTCAGFCGSVNSTACNPTLARGYASVTTNGGHEGGPGFDGVWAANAPELQEDFGWRSTHVVTVAAKAITRKYYGREIKYSYISGCSKGGQAALKEAQMFPTDYDGVLPIAPVYDYTGRIIQAARDAQAVSDGDRGSILNTAATEIIHKSVLEQCGAQSGAADGWVMNPLACDWKVDLVTCRPGADRSDCLQQKQADAVRRLMQPVRNSKGKVIYQYPFVPGTETDWGAWHYGTLFADFNVADQYFKYLVDAKVRSGAGALSFDFDRDPQTLSRARRIYDATSPDLRAFKARGGKILVWHGWSDTGISALSSIGYREDVAKAMGGHEKVDDFFRLFLIPGVHHCGGGPGLADFDALTLLENWVEKGQAPDVMVARRIVNGEVVQERPIYSFPVQSRYVGGDPKLASSFKPI